MINRILIPLLLLIALCAGLSGAQSPPSSATFCESVRTLVEASYTDFREIKRNVERHRDGSTDWTPSVVVAGTSECAGQSDPEVPSTVSCTGAQSQSLDELETVYQNAVKQLRSCLDQRFVFEETHGGKATRLSTPIKEASFEVKGKDDAPNGPTVRITLDQWHGKHDTYYEITIWVDAKAKD